MMRFKLCVCPWTNKSIAIKTVAKRRRKKFFSVEHFSALYYESWKKKAAINNKPVKWFGKRLMIL